MSHFCDAQLQFICFKPRKPQKTGAIIERSKSEIDVVEASSLYPFVVREWKIPSFILQDCIYFIFDPLQRRNLKLPAGFKSTKPQKQKSILLTKKKCIKEKTKKQTPRMVKISPVVYLYKNLSWISLIKPELRFMIIWEVLDLPQWSTWLLKQGSNIFIH